MNKEQYDKVVESLVDFIVRVSKNETASDAEVSALPETVLALVRIIAC